MAASVLACQVLCQLEWLNSRTSMASGLSSPRGRLGSTSASAIHGVVTSRCKQPGPTMRAHGENPWASIPKTFQDAISVNPWADSSLPEMPPSKHDTAKHHARRIDDLVPDA